MAWYDFAKAFDSVHHHQLRRLVRALPIHEEVRKTLSAMRSLWSVTVEVGRERTPPIYVRRGMPQGDSMSPLLFVLVTAFIIEEVKTNSEITKAARGKQEVGPVGNASPIPSCTITDLTSSCTRQTQRRYLSWKWRWQTCGTSGSRSESRESGTR